MSDPSTRTDRVLTREEQEQLAPDHVLELLYEGNARFVRGDMTHRDHIAQIRAAVAGQWPKAVVLSCLDSRIPVEDVEQNVRRMLARVRERNAVLRALEHAGRIRIVGAMYDIDTGEVTPLA